MTDDPFYEACRVYERLRAAVRRGETVRARRLAERMAALIRLTPHDGSTLMQPLWDAYVAEGLSHRREALRHWRAAVRKLRKTWPMLRRGSSADVVRWLNKTQVHLAREAFDRLRLLYERTGQGAALDRLATKRERTLRLLSAGVLPPTTAMERRIRLLMRRKAYDRAAPLLNQVLRQKPMDHLLLVERGLCDHGRHRYTRALRWFERARTVAPDCPLVIYNVANTGHMCKRDDEAVELLTRLTRASLDELRAGCPESADSVRGVQTDAWYLLFCVAFWRDPERDWARAAPYLREHLARRRRGMESLWSLATLRRELAELRQQHHLPQIDFESLWRECRGLADRHAPA